MSDRPATSLRLRSPLPEPRVRDRLLVICDRRHTPFGLSLPQGLFGEFFSVLGALRYAERHGAAGVRADFSSAYYLDPALGPNWWAYYFADTMWLRSAAPSAAAAVRCRGQHRYGPYAWNEPWSALAVPRNSSRRPFPIDSASDLSALADLATRHLRVAPPFLARAAALRARFAAAGDFVIGLHLRGTDKVLNYPHRTPAFATYAAEVDRILAHRRPARHRIFVATDQTELAAAARRHFGAACFLLEDSPRLSSADRASDRLGVHKHAAFGPRVRGESALLDCLLLAGCDYLVKNRSGLSDAALVLNPRLPWTFILDDAEIHRGASADGSVAAHP
jgi:hypothetical protein